MQRPPAEKRRQSICSHRLGDIPLNDRSHHFLLPNLLESEEEYRYQQENNGISYLTRGDSDRFRQPTVSQNDVTQAQFPDFKFLENANGLARNLSSILIEIRKVTAKIRQEEEETEIKNEWRFAALVIDRLCLWFCLVTTLVSTLAILCSAPHLVA